jgi:hypothetical protein
MVCDTHHVFESSAYRCGYMWWVGVEWLGGVNIYSITVDEYSHAPLLDCIHSWPIWHESDNVIDKKTLILDQWIGMNHIMVRESITGRRRVIDIRNGDIAAIITTTLTDKCVIICPSTHIYPVRLDSMTALPSSTPDDDKRLAIDEMNNNERVIICHDNGTISCLTLDGIMSVPLTSLPTTPKSIMSTRLVDTVNGHQSWMIDALDPTIHDHTKEIVLFVAPFYLVRAFVDGLINTHHLHTGKLTCHSTATATAAAAAGLLFTVFNHTCISDPIESK